MLICNAISCDRHLDHSIRAATILTYHNTLGHFGASSVRHAMGHEYWFPLMASTIENTIRTCPRCPLTRSTAEPALLRPIPPAALPLRRWSMDIVGPFPDSSSGNRFIITAMEHHTRWVVAKATNDISGPAIVNFVYTNIIMEFGNPIEIITDNGKQFIEGAFREYENLLKTRHKATTPYHPQSNGMVERMHRDLNHSLRTLTMENPNRWDEYLAEVVFAMRCKKHATTNYTPFFLMHGVEPRLPIDPKPPRSFMKPLTAQELLENRTLDNKTNTLEQLGYARQEAYEHSVDLARKLAIRSHPSRRKRSIRNSITPLPAALTPGYSFQVGDLVLQRNHLANKLDPRWSGPHLIAKLGYPGSYWLKDINTGTLLPRTISDAHLAFWTVATPAQEESERKHDVNVISRSRSNTVGDGA